MIISDEQLKNLILKRELIDQKKLQEIIQLSQENNLSLIETLVEKDVISDTNLGLIIADSLNIPFISLAKTFIPEETFHIIPERIARKYKIIPFERNNQEVKIAVTDHSNKEIQTLIAKKTGLKVIPYLATERDINNTLHIYRKDLKKTLEDMLKTVSSGKIQREIPVIEIVDLLINYAYQDKASDVHIEITENNSLIRFRIDGILHDALSLPKILHDRIITRIKVLSRLRTDEHLSAQDGKMRLKLEEEYLDIRISIIPTVEGEKAVLRLLSSRSRKFSFLELGMNEQDLKKINNAISKSYGMILATGPTGSGKTSSIYAILKILNTREKNITTIEDPVEYRIKGVNQTQVNPKTNLTFANGLRSLLRQDPNIVFVGEIRDNETAAIAVNAALTGHLVLSTLHTNDAATALPRLIDMKVEPFLVASTVNIIIAQRLVRKICEKCKVSITVNQNDLINKISKEIIKKIFGNEKEKRLFSGKGCKICHFTGYLGREAIFELLEITNSIRKLISSKSDSSVILEEAVKEGMTTILDNGLEKVKKGITTIEEVLRVTKVESL